MFILLAVLFFACALGEELGETKVIICHVPNGDLSKVRPISIGSSAKAAHLAHGDFEQLQFPDPDVPGATITTCSDPCIFDVCKNGGTCSYIANPPFPYTCACVGGWLGPNCDIDPCAPNPCQNSGACSRTPSGSNYFTCTCVDGWLGEICDIDPCAPNPCQNSGACSRTPSGSNDFTCTCVDGWVGEECQINPCDPNPCQNSGTCSRTPSGSNDFTCTCGAGFYGPICDSNSVCSPACASGQSCTNHVCVTNGQLFFRIIWNQIRDIDLSVTTPSGKFIYYNNPGSNLATDYGRLEIDSDQKGPENIYWSDTSVVPTGTYYVCINDYSIVYDDTPAHLPVTLTYGSPGNIHTTTYTTGEYWGDVCSPTATSYVLSFSYP